MDLVNSIVKAVRIIDLLKHRGSLSYNDILKTIPLPKSTLFKILSTLEAEELVRRDPDNGRYQLGVKLIEWGSIARSQLEIRNIALPFMKKLSESLDCTVHLTVLAHGEVLPIESFESGNRYWQHFNFPGAVGTPAPLHATAGGKAIAAYLNAEEIDKFIQEKGLEKYTEHTITDPKGFIKELKSIRTKGFAISNSEHDELIRSVAAPIFDHDGRVIAAMSVLGLISKFTTERINEIVDQVTEAAKEVSRLFGYISGPPPV